MKKLFLIAAVVVLGLSACQKTELADNNLPVQRMKGQEITDQDNYLYKKKFAIALNDAMYKSEPLRKFIRDKALEKFDSDYDVLYNYVSENVIDGTGLTFRQLLAKSFENPAELDEIAQKVPLLTIFVPTLPNNSFSAEKWNVEKEVPLVAVKVRGCSEVPIFTRIDTIAFKLQGNIIPGFPIVVIKDNERVILPDNPRYEELLSQKGTINFYDEDGNLHSASYIPPIYRGGPHGDFPFIVPVEFDWTQVQQYKDMPLDYPATYWERVSGGKEVKEAWDRLGKNNPDYWQRDYIYYGIDNTTINGRYINKYHEMITDFEMRGSGKEMVSHISGNSGLDLGDPTLKDIRFEEQTDNINLSDFWTEGAYEFGVNFNIFERGNTATGTGGENSYQLSFEANWYDLFNISYTSKELSETVWIGHHHPWWWWAFLPFTIDADGQWIDEYSENTYYVYSVTDITSKTYHLTHPVGLQTPWRLEDYSNKIKVSLEEIDYTEEVTTSITASHQFNTNFSTNWENGGSSTSEGNTVTYKNGGQFGGSQQTSFSSTETTKQTKNSNDLGASYIFFGNDVIVSRGTSSYSFYKTPMVFCNIVVRPMMPQ